ncbi:PTB domain-containing engulfment adapter protein 1-like [Synchiropus splendidus]|uniref:PTB domain-containing engulfment adapter protein 1-like n=1 Tax=Synchiropus splendidus TaxID=270530 RepID=UPI00237E74D4|nr:PTB domain-containing engulfment adapter protein 1-like [Synchiropus splendidus]
MEAGASAAGHREITFSVKFLGRVQVVRPDGLTVLDEAAKSLQTPDQYSSEKASKRTKVHLTMSLNGINILENKTKYLLYTCPLPNVSFCAVLPSSPEVFGFVAKHQSADIFHCYLFRSRKFSHVLVTVIGDAFAASREQANLNNGQDLIVEGLRYENRKLKKENLALKKRLAGPPSALVYLDSDMEGNELSLDI